MAEGTPENKERNDKLIADYFSGLSIVELINKYRISSAAIYAIFKRRKVSPNRFVKDYKWEE